MRVPRVLSVMAAAVVLTACGQADEPAEGPAATPVPGPTITPSPTPSPAEDTEQAADLLACLEDEGLDAEEGPAGDMQEQFQVGVGSHPQFRFQAVILGYEDRQQAAEDKDQTERGAEEIGADLPEILLVGNALIFVLDEDIPQSDLQAIEDCIETTV